MDRTAWQKMANRWLKDAKRLLDGKRWAAAYHVMGYALEFGLKACLIRHVGTKPEIILEDRKLSDKAWTHSLADLVKLAEMETDRAAHAAANPGFEKNWGTALDWNEKSRYGQKDHREAKKLFKAITDKKDGVVTWIKDRW
ncbi:MAG: HEPN domain-containing protein [Gemmataceae bacterium]|nr:HEPN domain-containing protein [Gemmataceae bacterium]